MNDHVTKAVTLVNAGSLMYEFGWRLGSNSSLAISPSAGSAGPGDRVVCELTFSPTSSHQRLDHYKVACKVVNGRTYTLLLSGQSSQPAHFASYHCLSQIANSSNQDCVRGLDLSQHVCVPFVVHENSKSVCYKAYACPVACTTLSGCIWH